MLNSTLNPQFDDDKEKEYFEIEYQQLSQYLNDLNKKNKNLTNIINIFTIVVIYFNYAKFKSDIFIIPFIKVPIELNIAMVLSVLFSLYAYYEYSSYFFEKKCLSIYMRNVLHTRYNKSPFIFEYTEGELYSNIMNRNFSNFRLISLYLTFLPIVYIYITSCYNILINKYNGEGKFLFALIAVCLFITFIFNFSLTLTQNIETNLISLMNDSNNENRTSILKRKIRETINNI